MNARGREYPGLADDLVNFHWDPVTAAVAAGWSGASIEGVKLETQLHGRTLVLHETHGGQSHQIVTDIDADAFTDAWLTAVETADGLAATRRGSAPK